MSTTDDEEIQPVIDSWADEPFYEINTPEFERVEFNRVEIEVGKVIERLEELDWEVNGGSNEAESYAHAYYQACGFNTLDLKAGIAGRRSTDKNESRLKDYFPFFEKIDLGKAGVPDMFVFRVFQELKMDGFHTVAQSNVMHNYRFVEVKSENDGLRPSQIRWIGQHVHHPIDIAIITESDEDS